MREMTMAPTETVPAFWRMVPVGVLDRLRQNLTEQIKAIEDTCDATPCFAAPCYHADHIKALLHELDSQAHTTEVVPRDWASPPPAPTGEKE